MFDHLLESSRRDDSNKWSNKGFGQEIGMIEMKIRTLSGALCLCLLIDLYTLLFVTVLLEWPCVLYVVSLAYCSFHISLSKLNAQVYLLNSVSVMRTIFFPTHRAKIWTRTDRIATNKYSSCPTILMLCILNLTTKFPKIYLGLAK